MKRVLVVMVVLAVAFSVAVSAKRPINVGGGTMFTQSSPINVGGGTFLSSSPINVGGGTFTTTSTFSPINVGGGT